MALTGIEGVVSGNVAGVDANNRLLTLATPDLKGRTVNTSQVTILNGANVTVNAMEDRHELVLQNQTGVPVTVMLAAANAGANDLVIAPGATFVVPFRYTGEFRLYGVGGGGNFMVIQTGS